MKHDPEATAALLETVQNQITGEEALEVRVEYMRLLRERYIDTEARATIAYVLGCHLVKMMRRESPFDYAD